MDGPLRLTPKGRNLHVFKYSAIWGQSYCTKPPMAFLVDAGASFDTPGVLRGGSI